MLNVKFKYMGSTDVEFISNKHVTFIIDEDESATGKTLLFNIIEDYFKSTSSKIVFRIDYYNYLTELKRFDELIENENNVIIFDDAGEFIDLFQYSFENAKANIIVAIKFVSFPFIRGDFVVTGKVLNSADSIKFVED